MSSTALTAAIVAAAFSAVDIADLDRPQLPRFPVAASEFNGYELPADAICSGDPVALPLAVHGSWIETRFAEPLKAEGAEIAYTAPGRDRVDGDVEILVLIGPRWASLGGVKGSQFEPARGEADASKLKTLRFDFAKLGPIAGIRLVRRGPGRLFVSQVRPIVDGDPMSCRPAVETFGQ